MYLHAASTDQGIRAHCYHFSGSIYVINSTAPSLLEFAGLRVAQEDYVSQKADPEVVNS